MQLDILLIIKIYTIPYYIINLAIGIMLYYTVTLL